MIYTVGEMAQKLDVPASTLRYYDKKGYFPLWSVPPAAFGCSGKPTSSGCRSSAAGCSGAAASGRECVYTRRRKAADRLRIQAQMGILLQGFGHGAIGLFFTTLLRHLEKIKAFTTVLRREKQHA